MKERRNKSKTERKRERNKERRKVKKLNIICYHMVIGTEEI
jgi:hypothetical protein